MKNILKITLSLLFIAASFTSCVDDKDFDTPQVGNDCTNDDTINAILAQENSIKDFQYVEDIANSTNEFAGINDNKIYIVGYVVSSDIGGNFYKEIFIQDKAENPTKAVRIAIESRSLYTKYRVGTKVLVLLNGLSASVVRGELSIGENINGGFSGIREKVVKDHIIKACDNSEIVATEITNASEINYGMIGQLVKVMDAQFALDDLGNSFFDPFDSYDSHKDVVFCSDESTLSIETGGFAAFAGTNLPNSKFNMTGILTRNYSNTFFVLKMRSTDDIEKLDTERCDPPVIVSVFSEDFEDFTDWTKYSVTGAQLWESDATHGNPDECAKMSGYNGGPNANEDWLITPAISLDGVTNSLLAFQTAKNYNGPDLEVLVSNDYVPGENPNNSGTWTTVSATLSTGNWTWTNSGQIDLSNFDGQGVYVAFKYTSTSSSSATFEVDNVVVGYLE